ncbi:hypothetical protein U1700_08070 [Sphingomonas sp. RB1R13]
MSMIDMAVWLAANSVSRLAVGWRKEGGKVVNKVFHLGPAILTPRQGPAILKRVAGRRQDGPSMDEPNYSQKERNVTTLMIRMFAGRPPQ